jgi:hypothetical protein
MSRAMTSYKDPYDTGVEFVRKPKVDRRPLPRVEWRAWDEAAAERANDARYHVGKKLERGTLRGKELAALATRIYKIGQFEKALEVPVETIWQGGLDGRLTEKGRAQLRELADMVRLDVWGEGPETPNLLPVVRKKLKAGALSHEETTELSAQLQRLERLRECLGMRRKLDDEDRADLTEEYNLLCAVLFEFPPET